MSDGFRFVERHIRTPSVLHLRDKGIRKGDIRQVAGFDEAISAVYVSVDGKEENGQSSVVYNFLGRKKNTGIGHEVVNNIEGREGDKVHPTVNDFPEVWN